ncbi:hypothetical protein MBLNU459_g3652t1 [Dothideomycetes sp. NU459]
MTTEISKRYVSTASVARDMLGIVQAHGQWREKEASRLSYAKVKESLKYKPGKEKIQYWGFSYGTLLGSTFAALYPDHIERFILDGVVDAEDYTANDWQTGLHDTEKVLQSFYHHCARVGYPTCELAYLDATEADVEKRVKDIIAKTFHNPLPVPGTNPEVIEYSDLRRLMAAALYFPINTFPMLAKILASVEKGDGAEFAADLRNSHEFSCPASSAQRTPGDVYAITSIICGDGDDQTDQNKTSFVEYMSVSQELSPTIGDIWASIRLDCIGWTSRPWYRFTGPWKSRPSHPILWMGNTADPATPLHSAKKMAKGYEGSVVLTQDSPGHCTIAALSMCTISYIRRYLQTGELPPEGVVCPANQVPFGYGGGEVVEKDVQLGIQMYQQSGKALYAAGGGLMQGYVHGRRMASWF